MPDATAIVVVPTTRWVVAMPGEARRHVLQHALQTAAMHSPRVVLDGSKLTHIFSHQIGSILAVHKDLEARQGHLAVCALSEPVLRVLELLSLQELLHLYPDVESTLGALGWTCEETVEVDLPTCD